MTHSGTFSVNKKHKHAVLEMIDRMANERKMGISWKVIADPAGRDLVSINITWPQDKADPFFLGFLIGLNTMEIVYENNREYAVKKTWISPGEKSP